MKKGLLSIIVPVYNVEKYLRPCIESILNQEYSSFELFLIDDGSKDASATICDEYAKQDDRIHVIHKSNGGVGSARNLGLDNCKGEYITFVDSDDIVAPNIFTESIHIIDTYNSDMVSFGFDEFGDANDIDNNCRMSVDKPEILSEEQAFENLDRLRIRAWNKVFKRSIIGDLRFKIGQIYEDVYFITNAVKRCSCVALINVPLYHYRLIREGNTNSSFNPGRLVIFDEFNSVLQYLDQKEYINAANRFTMYALNFYIRLYEEAVLHSVDKTIQKRIIDNFKVLWKRTGINKTVKQKLFYVMPKGFYYLHRLELLRRNKK